MEPLQLAFYKGVKGKFGAIQFNFQRPHWYIKHSPKLKNYNGKYIPEEWLKDNPDLTYKDLTSREGALFMEIASATGENIYDWENKIIMALSITDLGKVLSVLEGLFDKIDIRHDPNAKSEKAGQVTKLLNIQSPDGLKSGVFFSVYQLTKENEQKISHRVPLSGDEVKVLAACIRNVLPQALAWT